MESIKNRTEKMTIKSIIMQHGITSQAYYKKRIHRDEESQEKERIIKLVIELRILMPKLGGRKLLKILVDNGLQIGRDRFFYVLREYDLLVHRSKNYIKTTNSKHYLYKWKNLIIQDEKLKERLLVSDITYIPGVRKYYYLFLVTEYKSRCILGYHLSESLETRGAMEALQMALKSLESKAEYVHHSDRGIQYCSKVYVEKLQKAGIKISMTNNGDPYENAVAERINGILKHEFLLNRTFRTFRLAKKSVDEAIMIYNTMRPHLTLNYKTPNEMFNRIPN